MSNTPIGHQRESARVDTPTLLNGKADALPRDDGIVFRDQNGRTWWAHLVSGDFFGASGRTCLLLASVEHVRRVWYFPADWRSLSPEELLRLPHD